MKKRALIVGINSYPPPIPTLRGCVPDAKNWCSLLIGTYGFETPVVLLESSATIENIRKNLTTLINASEAGDVLVWTFSGHGTSVPNLRPDKPDGRAEAIVAYDGLMYDSQIRGMMQTIRSGVHMTVISDSCHSGTVTRLNRLEHHLFKDLPQMRYFPPQEDTLALRLSELPVTSRAFIGEDSMVEILLSGCLATEYSNDANINGNFVGAFSYNAIDILRNSPTMTYNNFYAQLRARLPSSLYQQTPQLEGQSVRKAQPVFS